MLSWQLVSKSFSLVFNNLDVAFRTALLPLLVVTAASLAVQFLIIGNMDWTDPSATGQAQAFNIGLQLLNAVVALWIAVAWHRFVLLEEFSVGFWPKWHGREMLSYVGHGLLIGICMIALALPFLAVGFALYGNQLMTNDLPWGAIVAGIVVYLGLLGTAYRLVPLLPAAAIGRPLRLRDAWHATQGHTLTFVAMLLWLVFVLILLLIVFALVLGILGTALAAINVYLALIVLAPVGLLLNLIAMLIGISLFTTIYGHFIEGRALD